MNGLENQKDASGLVDNISARTWGNVNNWLLCVPCVKLTIIFVFIGCSFRDPWCSMFGARRP